MSVLSFKASPKITVCCLCYNHEPFIDKAISSIISQEYDGEIEVLIFDDHSTDKSRTKIEFYTKQFPEMIKLLSEDNNIYSRGFTPLYNLVSASTGRYLFFCECDDFWIDNHKISKQVAALEENINHNISFHPALILKNDIEDLKYGFNGNAKQVICLDKCIINNGPLMPLASIAVRAAHLKSLWLSEPDYFKKNAWHSVVQLSTVVPNGAIYLPDYMSVYRSMHEGSWSLNQKMDKGQYLRNYIAYAERLTYFSNKYSENLECNKMLKVALQSRAVYLTLTRGIKYTEKINAMKISGFNVLEIALIHLQAFYKACNIIFKRIRHACGF